MSLPILAPTLNRTTIMVTPDLPNRPPTIKDLRASIVCGVNTWTETDTRRPSYAGYVGRRKWSMDRVKTLLCQAYGSTLARVHLLHIKRSVYSMPSRPRQAAKRCALTWTILQCLLKWIETKQETAAMAEDTLKCPQCGTPYLIVSYNPPALQLLDRLTHFTSRVARIGAIISISSIVIVAGTTVIAMSTVYAAYAVEQFAGRDVFMLLYGDDITKWSLWAWMELPMIPVAVSIPYVHISTTLLMISRSYWLPVLLVL